MESVQESYQFNQAARNDQKGEPRMFQPTRFEYHERAESPRPNTIPSADPFQTQPPPYLENSTMVRDLSMEQPSDDLRDRIDSYSNDSLLNLTREELAQREREIFGDNYQQQDRNDLMGDLSNQTMDSIIPEPGMDPRVPSFIPREDLSQSTRVQHRPIGDYARDLIMWRNTKDSIVIFSFGGFLLFSLAYFSFISVVAYASLAVLLLATGVVFGRQVMYSLKQRQGEHPFQRLLERDVVIQLDYAHEQLDNLLVPLNQALVQMRNLFLADSLAQSLKLAFVMYIMTYIGAWFNLLSLAMMIWAMAFSLPKFYVMYRPQIDGFKNRIWRQLDGIRDWMKTVARRQRNRMVAANERATAKKGQAVKVEKTVTIEQKNQ